MNDGCCHMVILYTLLLCLISYVSEYLFCFIVVGRLHPGFVFLYVGNSHLKLSVGFVEIVEFIEVEIDSRKSKLIPVFVLVVRRNFPTTLSFSFCLALLLNRPSNITSLNVPIFSISLFRCSKFVMNLLNFL